MEMGNPFSRSSIGGISSESNSDSEDEDGYESASEYDSSTNQDTNNVSNYTSDALYAMPKRQSMNVKHLELPVINSIESGLEDYEKVSLIFLLYTDATKALNDFTTSPHNILFQWTINQECSEGKWQTKLIEGLCIIKNFQLLKTLGLQKSKAIEIYQPFHHFYTNTVDKMRKSLYFACESLTLRDAEKFLNKVKSDFNEKKLTFKNFPYLELYFMYWFSINYISSNDLHNVIKIFKVLDLEDICDILESVSSIPANNRTTDTNIEETNSAEVLRQILDDSHDFTYVTNKNHSSSSEDSAPLQYDEKYDMTNPGVCLIINQENFYTEIDIKYKHLLPRESNTQMQERLGTQRDSEKLEKTFMNRGFKVILKTDRTHLEIIADVKEATKNITNESCLFVCILSHGDEGVVYGVNSCEVEVTAIREIMCGLEGKNNLTGKPKVLILQSCQGSECLKVTNELTTDGPSKQKVYSTDMFTFWATVPGFGAVRNKKTGTWFIQSLCSKIDEMGSSHHFEEICTFILKDVSSKTWQKDNKVLYAMVPLKESTLTKNLYFPGNNQVTT